VKKIFLLFLLIVSSIFAVEFNPEEDVNVSIKTTLNNDTLYISLKIDMVEGYHISANELLNISFDLPKSDFQFIKINLPQKLGPQDFQYFEHNPEFTVIYKVLNKNFEKKSYNGVFSYQVCAEGENAMCFPPVDKNISLDLKNISKNNKTETTTIKKESNIKEEKNLSGKVNDLLKTGSFLVFLLVFLAGILTSFTPCVYPMIPIIISFIGARTENKKQGFKLSIFFALGLSVTYAILGLIAAQTGAVFGSLTQNVYVVGGIAIIFVAMGLSLLGLFEIQAPDSIVSKAHSKKRQGIVGAIFMGALTGFIGAPCVGPVLISLLAYVATTGAIIKGFFLLFTFGFGISVLFIVIGTFTGILKSLPSSGGWMDIVKYFFGIIMFFAAAYFIKPFISENLYHFVIGFLMIFTGLLFLKYLTGEGVFTVFLKSIFYLIITTGILYFSSAFIKSTNLNPLNIKLTQQANEKVTEPEWIMNDEEKAFEKAKKENKIVIVDFYAKWCAACNELDEITYVNPDVFKRLNDFVLLKFDCTDSKAQWVKDIQNKYAIKGLPTVIFMTPEKKELYRFFGFKKPEEFLKILDNLK